MCNAFVGSKQTVKVCEMSPTKVAKQVINENHPEMNFFGIFHEGVDNYSDIPHMGGKCKAFFKKDAAGDGWDASIESCKMGKWEYCEKYTEDGTTLVRYILH